VKNAIHFISAFIAASTPFGESSITRHSSGEKAIFEAEYRNIEDLVLIYIQYQQLNIHKI